MDLPDYLADAVARMSSWKDEYGTFETHSSLHVDSDVLQGAWNEYLERLKDNYPFFHPRYAGQMLKPPHPVAMAGYLAAMFVNPNNHALDGGPATARMEKEVIRDFARMFGFPETTLGHLTSSGTIANLEALWVARRIHPGKKVAYSEEAHYTHSRMCEVVGLESCSVSANGLGQMDVGALETRLRQGDIGTVVVTTGTTGLGAVDPVHEVLSLRKKYDFRVHVDAAYGGFFTLLARDNPSLVDAEPFLSIARCDSVAVDPHKHGLQPYGCGCVLFRDPTVGSFFHHDSPYTYFTSDDLHLGEISLECSRAGAAAGALWLTLQCFPLSGTTGLGNVLAQGRTAALDFYRLITESSVFVPFIKPALDIVAYYPKVSKTSQIDRKSQALFERAMASDDPVFTSVFRVHSSRLTKCQEDLETDLDTVRILRSVLMKPEHLEYAPRLLERLTEIYKNMDA